MSVHIIIPARYASTRLPAKALADLQGKPVLRWVYEQALKAELDAVHIATDHQKIYQAAEQWSASVFMTAEHHPNGTMRIIEMIELLGLKDDDIVVNVQGDDPLIAPENIKQVARLLQNDSAAKVATLCGPITDKERFYDPNQVKVVANKQGHALYFSRAPIPFPRDGTTDAMPMGHIGLYAYRVSFLKAIEHTPSVSCEETEKLEQLRWLWHGHTIAIQTAHVTPHRDVNTQADLDALHTYLGTVS